MRARQLETLLAMYSSRTSTDLDQRGRRLREVGLIPSSGPGRYAPDIDIKQAATILISAAASPMAIDAVAGVRSYASLVPVDGSLVGAKTFQKAVEMVLTDPWTMKVIEIEFMQFRDGAKCNGVIISRAARIKWTESGKDKVCLYVPKSELKDFIAHGIDPQDVGSGGLYPRMVVGSALLRMIALHLTDDESAGNAEDQALSKEEA